MHYRSLGVSIRKTPAGSGVFALKTFRKAQVIGEMKGDIGTDGDPSYVVDLEGQRTLEPHAPFRFLNHCCEPNAALVEETSDDPGVDPKIWVEALRTIRRGEQVTIDYGWPAERDAIRCLCGVAKCRGWVVAEEEVPKMERLLAPKRARSSTKQPPKRNDAARLLAAE